MVFFLVCTFCVGIESLFLHTLRKLNTRTELPIVILINVFTFIMSNILLRKLLDTGIAYDFSLLLVIIMVNLASIAVEYFVFSLAFGRRRLGFGIVSAANAIAFVLSFPVTYLLVIVMS